MKLLLRFQLQALKYIHLLLDKYMIKNKIKQLRETQGATQEEFASALKVSRQTIIAMEKGNYEPSLGLALKVAKFFDLPVEKIFTIN